MLKILPKEFVCLEHPNIDIALESRFICPVLSITQNLYEGAYLDGEDCWEL